MNRTTVWLAVLVIASAQNSPAQTSDCYASVGPALEKSKGQITDEVKLAYLDWAEHTVIQSLNQHGRGIPHDCLEEVDSDINLREAAFASVYPPDPSILQNYVSLRQQLGAEFTKTYRGLAIAVAVARRVKGVEANQYSDPAQPRDIGRENQPLFALGASDWIDEIIHLPHSEEEINLVHSIAKFMKRERVAALELYNGAELRKRLAAELKDQGYSDAVLREIKQSVPFGEWIKNAMIELGQRPAGRESAPVSAVWLKHLVSILEATPKSTPDGGGHPLAWPLFPVPQSPWPLLMSLAHAVPLSEANYIWEAFQGEYGDDRFHTYGPYRDELTAMPDMLIPSRWYWDAFPDRIIHGGVCVQISKGTVDLYSSLGLPSVWAGQPGHANLISYQHLDHDIWRAQIEQDFAGGAPVTYGQWFFGDEPHREMHFRDQFNWPCAEYHLGLALGMNLGLESYMKTRMAANIFQAMPAQAKPNLGMKMLEASLQENPFNPQIWYDLAGLPLSLQERITLLRAIKTREPGCLIGAQGTPALDSFIKSGRAGELDGNLNDYWQNVQDFVVHSTILDRATPGDEAGMKSVYEFLRDVLEQNPNDLALYADRFFQNRLKGSEAYQVDYDSKLAEQGDSYGLLRMGQRYYDGDGVPQDDLKSMVFLQKAARLGDPLAGITLERIAPALPTSDMDVAASSTYSQTQDVHHLIDGSGMQGEFHDNSEPAATMWQTVDHPSPSVPAPGLPASPAWVRFNFSKGRTFDALKIWNHNQLKLTDRGLKKIHVYATSDGVSWFPIVESTELPRASGQPHDTAVLIPNSQPARVFKSVIIAADSTDGNYGSATTYGLSAVRFVKRAPATIPEYLISVTASSVYSPTQSVRHLIDGSGLIDQYHDNSIPAATMWQSAADPEPTPPADGWAPSPAWVRFDFSQARKFEAIQIWNHNQAGLTDRGFRQARIYGTSNGTDWFPLTKTDMIYIPRASGRPRSSAVTFFNEKQDVEIKSVIIAAEPTGGNYKSNCFGLSAVRFLVHS